MASGGPTRAGRTSELTAFRLFAATCGFAAVVGVVLAITRSALVAAPGGCFGDGVYYCAMTLGRRTSSPFSRRVLVPLVVRALSFGSLASRFRLLDVVAILCAAVLVAVLIRRVAAEIGAGREAATAMGVAGGALLLITPFAAQGIVFVPIFTDVPALALGLAALAAITWRPTPDNRVGARLRLVAVFGFAATAVLTREAWLVPVLLGALVFDGALRSGWDRLRTFEVVLVPMLVAIGVDLANPYRGKPYDQLGESRWLLARYLFHGGGMAALSWGVLFVVGALPLVLVIAWPGRQQLRRAPTSLVLAVAAACHLFQSAVGGGEISRIAWPGAVCLLILGFGWAAADLRHTLLPTAVAVAGSILLWRPWVRLRAPIDYVRYMTPSTTHGVLRHRFEVDVPVALMAAVACFFAARWSGRSDGSFGSPPRATAPGPAEPTFPTSV